jgi:hypothetical protein
MNFNDYNTDNGSLFNELVYSDEESFLCDAHDLGMDSVDYAADGEY